MQEINEDAFAYNPVIEKVNISDNVYRILAGAFFDCKNLKEVKMSGQVWGIGSNAFSACTSLKEISLPESMTVLGNYVFAGNTSMEAVHSESEIIYDVDGVLFDRDGGIGKVDELVFYPPAKQGETYCIPNGTKWVGAMSFCQARYVKDVIIPQSVTEVITGGGGAFGSNVSLIVETEDIQNPINIVYKHEQPTDGILSSKLPFSYHLPAGSTITVKNEEMAEAARMAITEEFQEDISVQISSKASTGFELEKDSFVLSLWNGETAQLKWTQTPADTTDNITWTSSDETVAKADPVLGKITPEGYGTCTITGVDESGHTKKVSVLVYDACTSHSFELYYSENKKECTLNVADDQSWELAKAKADGYAGAMSVKFVVEDTVNSNPEIVEIERDEDFPNNIFIVPKKPGTATLTAIFDDNGTEIRDSIVVHVVDDTSPDPADPNPDKPDPGDLDKPDPVKPDPATKKQAQSLKYTKTYQKTYGNKPFSLNVKQVKGNGKLSYSSSDKKVAVVNSKGKVTIKGTGRTIITVTAAATDNYQKKSVKITLNVSPKKAVLTSVKAVKGRKLTVKWKKDAKASGYQLQYSTDKKFKKNVKTVTASKNRTISKTVSKLKMGKRYYIRVRAYKAVQGNGKLEKLYGTWSAVKQSEKMK